MSLATLADALRQWVTDTYGTSFAITVDSVAYTVVVRHDNLAPVLPTDTPAVRFTVVYSTSTEGSVALTEDTGALIAQVFTKQSVGPHLAEAIAAQIETDAKRTIFTTKGHFGAPVPQGPGSIEPEGLYQLNLRIPYWYLRAA